MPRMKGLKLYGAVIVAILPALLLIAAMTFMLRDLLRKPETVDDLTSLVLILAGIAIASLVSIAITIWLATQVGRQNSN